MDEGVRRYQLRLRHAVTVGGAQQVGDECGDLLDAAGEQHVEPADRTGGIAGLQNTADH